MNLSAVFMNKNQYSLTIEWNKYMKLYNRNKKNNLKIVYWNLGSSHLAKSAKLTNFDKMAIYTENF